MLLGSLSGSDDGAGTTSRFNSPSGLAIDASGIIYVADTDNHRIREIVPITSRYVGTLAGSTQGYDNGTRTAAKFNRPSGLAIDASGNLYVADTDNHRIRKIVISTGQVTTLAGWGQGYADGTGTLARFNRPSGVAVDASGNLYVADTDNNSIRKIVISTGQVTTLAGGGGQGYADGTWGMFNKPSGVAVDASGNLYVTDTGNYKIRKIQTRE
jgi:sugar lactone lactonase YvrE